MVCNLAVAITRAALKDERLKALIDEHLDEVTALMAKYLHGRHPLLHLAPGRPGTGQLAVGDGLSLSIREGAVTLSGRRTSRTAQYMEDLSQETTSFLKLVADQLFTQEVERTLKSATPLLRKQTKDVESTEGVQRATVYTVQINGLSARVFVLPNARMQIFIDNGTFAAAKTATLQLLGQLQAQGLPLQMMGEVEQHRSDGDHVHVRTPQQWGGRS